MKDLNTLVDALVETAARWRDPGYGPRAEAVARTLGAPNRFTEEAVAFAVNQQMHLLTEERLRSWLGGRRTDRPCSVGVLNAGNVPLADLQDFLAVVLVGHRYVGSVSSKSPYLLPAFAEEVRTRAGGLPAHFATAEEVFDAAEAVIATGTDETQAWAERQCEGHEIPSERRLLRGHRYSVAVLDGDESEDEREGLAEDALLHEGYGCRNVALVWAPRDIDPDPYLNAFAAFRGVFPAHPETPGTLKMQEAFLEAVGQSYAAGEGLEFLVSRGEPEVQRPGHVRWVEYDHLEEVESWLSEHARELQLVAARPPLARRLQTDLPVENPGAAQRPSLTWRPDGMDTIAFLAGLE